MFDKKDSFKRNFSYFLKGICVGGVDIIPGVSGGTMALILSIYEKLIFQANNLFEGFIKSIKNKNNSFHGVDMPFVAFVALGLLVGISLVSRLILFLTNLSPALMYGFFVALILAASISLFISNVTKIYLVFFSIFGLLCGFLISFIEFNLSSNPLTLIFSGFLALLAMVLPGVSGAYVLVILGQYELILQVIKNPFIELSSFLYFSFGALFGLLVAIKFLSKAFESHKKEILSFMSGLMMGSLIVLLEIALFQTSLSNGLLGINIGMVLALLFYLIKL